MMLEQQQQISPAADLSAQGTAYRVYGHGEALVMIHGVGMGKEIWEPQITEFEHDYQVIVYDMFGHGGSLSPPEHVRLRDYAIQLLQLLDELGVRTANIVGHSMGALVALEFAIHYPSRVLRVVALNAVFMRSAEQRAAVQKRASTLKKVGVSATIDSTLSRWFSNPLPDELQEPVQRVKHFLTHVQPEGYARTYCLFANSDAAHASALPHLKIPALFMTGEYDLNSSPDMSRAMAELAPQGKLSIVPGERHMMNVTAPTLINQRLRSFLKTAQT